MLLRSLYCRIRGKKRRKTGRKNIGVGKRGEKGGEGGNKKKKKKKQKNEKKN